MRNIRSSNNVKTVRTLLVLFFVSICTATTVLAQDLKNRDVQQQRKWTIELSSGFRSEIFESTSYYKRYNLKAQLSFPQIEMNFWYSIKDYFALESGIAYVKYNTNWDCEYKMFIPKHNLYSALQIPLRVRFFVPFKKNNFSFFSSTGIVLQFPLQSKIPYAYIWNNHTRYFDGAVDDATSFGKTHYQLCVDAPIYGINILLNTKIGIMYKFDFGLGISVFGEYYKGFRTMAVIDATYTKVYSGIPSSTQTNYETKGDYWNAGIGISYSFKQSNNSKKNK